MKFLAHVSGMFRIKWQKKLVIEPFVWFATVRLLLSGALYGYGSRGKETFDRFVVENKHEMFKSPKDAQNILRKDMLKHAARG